MTRNIGPLYLDYKDAITNEAPDIRQQRHSMESKPNQIVDPPNARQRSKSTDVMAEAMNETRRQARQNHRTIVEISTIEMWFSHASQTHYKIRLRINKMRILVKKNDKRNHFKNIMLSSSSVHHANGLFRKLHRWNSLMTF